MRYCEGCEAEVTETDYEAGACTQCGCRIVRGGNKTVKYRILRPSDLIRFGDERWDFEFGWAKVTDAHLERFSREYRRAGKSAWRFRRPVTDNEQRKRTRQ